MFVLLFLAGGGPIGEEVILGGSAPPTVVGSALEGPDIDSGGASCTDTRFLLFALAGEVMSCLTGVSAVVGRVCEGERPAVSGSALSIRFDIGLYR